MDNSIIQKINFEIDEIDELLSSSSPLFDLCKIREPDYIERCAIALILHSFYNGIENIILIIIKNKENKIPNGTNWHKELLDMTFEITEDMPAIFNNELNAPLKEYLKFRHFIRHTYGYKLKWEEMKFLFLELKTVWKKVKENLKNFIENGKQQ